MPRLYTVKQFCAAYGMGRTRLYDLIAQGKIEAVKDGPKTLIPTESAEAWAASLPRFKSGAAAAPRRA
ncbi:helix-turn-helix domain-containing protein [Terricaulis sp.]|uniref:helix-turn-helix domain-containing protein n=1 Tax=Terricaulis sp. TaxID=2768686 RepID=UPI002AC3FEBC|nr:helix-turn-helix domain-containing protein [Terricaulis sp.]MDZ4692255.1 helix-turn-helix domain-containing protein [Terricaulis sp.]